MFLKYVQSVFTFGRQLFKKYRSIVAVHLPQKQLLLCFLFTIYSLDSYVTDQFQQVGRMYSPLGSVPQKS